MKKRSDLGKMQLSYGMIFSIILIIVFVFFAFYAIRTFLRINDSTKISDFVNSFQGDIDDLWKGSQGNQKVSYSLPSNAKQVCFEDRGDGNLLLYGADKERVENVPIFQIEHIDLEKIIGTKKEVCIDVDSDKVNMYIEKKYGEDTVLVKKS